MENRISKSNGPEIAGILYFILATQIKNPVLAIIFWLLGATNMMESIYWSFKFKGQ